MSPELKNDVHTKHHTMAQYFLLFVAISFLGWVVETISCSLYEGGLCDRGFLTLPLCTIYGFTVLGLYGLIGTPDQGGILLRNVNRKPARAALYFVLAAVIPTAVELVVGWFFTEVCGVSLWDYSAYRFNYKGYICLEFAILWGLLILLGMKFVFGPMKRVIGTLPEAWLFWTSLVLAVLLAADWGVNYARILF